MSFFSRSYKSQNGFNVVIEILDNTLELHLIAVNGGEVSELSKSVIKHRLNPRDGINEQEIDKFTDTLTKGFATLADEVLKKIGKTKIKIQGVRVIIFPPWYLLERKDDIRVGKDGELNTIKQSGIEELLNTAEASALPKNNPIAAYAYKKTVIEAFVNSIKLNGYFVANPVGKRAKDVTVSASLYTASAGLLETIRKTIHYHAGVEPNIFTFPRACVLYSQKMKLEPPVLFIDVENEETSLCVVSANESSIYITHEVDYGLDQITKNIVDKTGTDMEIAHSYIRLMEEMLFSDNASILAKSAVEESLSIWRSKIDESIASIMDSLSSYSDPLPKSRVLLCRDSKLADIFKKKMNEGRPSSLIFESDAKIDKIIFESSAIAV